MSPQIQPRLSSSLRETLTGFEHSLRVREDVAMTRTATVLMRVAAELFIGCGLLAYVVRDTFAARPWR